ncbi:MAG: glycosyltransferase family 2 protein [Thermoleophilia bacterium]|nr:glycosyltransferase family 2 protein [Thermoleophilia bacterium]
MIVSYECAAHLDRCLRALDAARHLVPMEVHVVDNASTDGGDAVAAARPWVHLERMPRNAGFAVAANRGLAGAETGAVLVLNPDAHMSPRDLLACLDRLAADPSAGVLTPRVVDQTGRFDGRCRRGFPTVPAALGVLTGLDRRFPRLLGGYTMAWRDPGEPVDVVAVSGAVMFIRTEALRAAGGFDERYFMYAEDMDLCIRIARLGWRIRYWPGATAVHAGGASGRPVAAREAFWRSMAVFTRRHRPGPRGLPARVAVTATTEVAVAAARLRRWRPAAPPTSR